MIFLLYTCIGLYLDQSALTNPVNRAANWANESLYDKEQKCYTYVGMRTEAL